MTERAALELDTLTIRIPIRLQRRGGRKLIVTPEGAVPTPKPSRDQTLVKALVRAHRWRRRIESGQAKSITDLAEQEGVTDTYVCRFLPLTCLVPDILWKRSSTGSSRRGLGWLRCWGTGRWRGRNSETFGVSSAGNATATLVSPAQADGARPPWNTPKLRTGDVGRLAETGRRKPS
jgi:hypothetical protein